METQGEVSQAMEALHAKAAHLALRLERAGDLLLPEAPCPCWTTLTPCARCTCVW